MRSHLPLLLLGLAACTPDPARLRSQANVVEEMPAWRTEEGRKAIWHDVARWAIDNGLPDEALAMVARLHEAGEHSPELDVIQARALHAQGLPSEARAKLDQVVKAAPRSADAWRALGVVLADLKDTQGAVDALRRALKLDADDTATRNNLGFLLLALDQCPEAVEHLTRCVSEDGTSARYRNNLAFALVCAGDTGRALDLFRSTGTEVDARYNLGLAHERMGRIPDALIEYEQALALDPDYPPAKDALARLETGTPTSTPDAGDPR